PHERARDGHALALATRQRRRAVLGAVADADALERVARRAPALARGDACVEQAVGDVVERGVRLEQEELLEDEADAPRAQRRERALGCDRKVLARDSP